MVGRRKCSSSMHALLLRLRHPPPLVKKTPLTWVQCSAEACLDHLACLSVAAAAPQDSLAAAAGVSAAP